MSLPTINLGQRLESALASGHPWVYRNHLPKNQLQTGDWVRLEAGKESSIGLFDEEGAIAVRLFDKTQIPDRSWVQQRVRQAINLRASIKEDSTAYRLINGENDFFPGIVADKYERYIVIKSYTESVKQLIEAELTWVLSKELKPKGILWRTKNGLEPLWGQLPPPEVTIKENGLSFLANLYEGQKTGLFLDQRENRQTVRSHTQDASVLNLFSYNGAFSVYALAGGASFVRSVDIAQAANRDAGRNVELNSFSNHEAVSADVFEILKTYAKEKECFDVVILDPPSLAKDKKSRFSAIRAYKRLNTLAMKCVNPGGLLISSSCTSQVFPDAFKTLLAEAAVDAGMSGQIIHEAGHALDHPVALHFPEGRYLKFVAMRLMPRER